MGINAILEYLDKVKGSNGRYQACCPAHDDKSPSLAISESPDGKVLLKCFAGCTADEIVGSIGMELKDLFPPSNLNPEQRQAYARQKTRAEIEEAFYHELVVMTQIIAARVADRKLAKDTKFRTQRPDWKPLPDATWEREELAVKRIRTAFGEIYDR
jgi:DNA primase